MTGVPLELVVPLALAAGFRIRGAAEFEQWWDRAFPAAAMLGGATTARIVAWAIPVGIFAGALHGGWHVGILAGVAAWIGCLPPWWRSLDLGRREGAWLQDFALHTLRGFIWTAPVAAVAWWFGGEPAPLLIAGALCGLIYEIGYRVRQSGQTELAEAVFGFVVGLALTFTFA